MPTYREDLHSGHKVPLVETDDISDGAINTQKIANDSVIWSKLASDVRNRINASLCNISVAPEVIMRGQQSDVQIYAFCFSNADRICIKRNGIDIVVGSGTELSILDVVTPLDAADIVYTAEFTFGEKIKESTKILSVAQPIYYGTGTTYQDAIHIASVRTSPKGEYNIDVTTSGSYIFFVVPGNMTIRQVLMNGLPVPMQAPAATIIGGVGYNVYQSTLKYNQLSVKIEVK